MDNLYLQKQHRIMPSEADALSLWRPDAIFTAMQELAGEHSDLLGCGRSEILAQQGIVWMLARVHLVMERYPALGDEVSIKTWPGATGRATFPRYFEIFSQDSERLGMAATSWVLADLTTRKLVLPSAAKLFFPEKPAFRAPMDEPARFRVDASGGTVISRKVCYSDVDENGHVNNARYVTWISDLFELERHMRGRIFELKISFLSEVRPEYGSAELALREEGAEFFVIGKANGNTSFEAAGRWNDLNQI